MSLNSITIVGNLTDKPKEKVNENGKVRAIFTVAVSEKRGETEYTHFVDVTAFGYLAKGILASLDKGQMVVIAGRVNQYTTTVETTDGEKKIGRMSVTAEYAGPDLTFQTAVVSKVSNGDSQAKPAAAKAFVDNDF